MQGVAGACAVVLAALLTVAAVAKLRDRPGTARSFSELGLRPARLLAGAVPASELVAAAALIARPAAGGALAALLLAGFTAVLAIGRHKAAPCACFGSSGSRPVTTADIVRNGILLTAALLALFGAGPGAARPSLAGAIVVTAAAVVLVVGVTLADGRRLASRS
jgi:uncharacterized membrane protein YphA (DoxX/SURF4 family)